MPASNKQSPQKPTGPRPDAVEDLNCLVSAIGPQNVDLEAMARDQPMDPEYRQLAADARTGLHFKKVLLGTQQLIVDVSNGPARPFVPFSWRRRIFEAIHNLGHPGVERTRQSIAAKFVWPSLKADVSRWARECVPCQRAKINRHVVPPLGDFNVPDRRFSHLNLDLVMLPVSNGFSVLLTAVDRFTRWPIAIPMKDAAADTVADAFAHGWVASYGVPSSITTDRGAQFSSAIWQQLTTTWGIKSHFTTAYHPAANGLVERFHRRLKEALVAMGNDTPNEWYWRLPCVLLAIRTTLKPDVNASPADLVYGEGLAVPGELLGTTPLDDNQQQQQRTNTLNNLRLEVARLQPTATSAHRRPRVRLPEELRTCTHVFVRRGNQTSLASPYNGPYRVLSREPNSFRIAMPGGNSEAVSINRLKPAFTMDDEDLDDVPDHPPSPPPGRRPDPHTQQPEPTSRQTRQQGRRPDANQAYDPGEGPSRQGGIPGQPPSGQHQDWRRERATSPFSDETEPLDDPNLDRHLDELRQNPMDVSESDNDTRMEPVVPPPPPQPPQPPTRRRPGAGSHGGTWHPRPNVSSVEDPAVEQDTKRSTVANCHQPRFLSPPEARKFSRHPDRPNVNYAAVLSSILHTHVPGLRREDNRAAVPSPRIV